MGRRSGARRPRHLLAMNLQATLSDPSAGRANAEENSLRCKSVSKESASACKIHGLCAGVAPQTAPACKIYVLCAGVAKIEIV